MSEDRKNKRERSSDQPVECPTCGALFKDETRLGTHRFSAHNEDRRDKERQEGPKPPSPKQKQEPKTEPKSMGDPPAKKPRGWFSGRPQ